MVLYPEADGTRLSARFGPAPAVWTLYVALYAVSLIMTLLCVAFGFAQWSAGQTPVALYFAPVALFCAGLVYGASYVGQGLGSAQMYALRAFVERCAAD